MSTSLTGYQHALVERAVELLSDGEWHDYETIMRELMKTIPPGPAIRRAEDDRRRSLKLPAGVELPARRFPTPHVELIRSGARSIVRGFLRHDNYETDQLGDPHGRTRDRRVRMVRRPMGFRIEEGATENALREEVARLRAQVKRMRLYLEEIGQYRAVQRLAPEEEQ